MLIAECASKVGFAGGIVVDYPNSTKAKKHYLVLSFERGFNAPRGLDAKGVGQKPGGVRVDSGKGGKGKVVRKQKGGGKTKEWILHKKSVQAKKDMDVRKNTRFTGRKRKDKF